MQTKSIGERVLGLRSVNWRQLQFIQSDDFKDLPAEAKHKLKASLVSNSFVQPFYVWEDPAGTLYCLDGKHRTLMLEELLNEGYQVPYELPAVLIDCANQKEAAKMVLVFSSAYAKVTEDGLHGFITLQDLDWADLKEMVDLPEFDFVGFESRFVEKDPFESKQVVAQSLQERFLVPPFSIFDTRQGYWQERKKKWHALGFDSQSTREDVELVARSGQAPAVYALRNKMRDLLGREPSWDEIIEHARKTGMHLYEGASVFDPVLCEVLYSWFVPAGGTVLDPFAGGSVRGIVAGMLGLNYWGIDLRKDQVEANQQQWAPLDKPGSNGVVCWEQGDSQVALDHFGNEVDFVFSCPPYHDLEQYSDDPADLSNMDYADFCKVYRSIITKAMERLKPNRFACFVVGDIRAKDGSYRNFVSETIDAFTKCLDANGRPVMLYNEIILVNVAGSLPVRVGRQFENSRKVGKMHQNVLVFFKGDPKTIKDTFPKVAMPEPEAMEEPAELEAL